MRLIIDIPDTQYNNIMETESMSLGRIPYKGIIMNAIKGIQDGTPIPDNATVCDIEQIRDEIERLHYHPKLDFIKNDEVVEMALDIIDKYRS
jgi:hypothetical protein